MDRLSSLATLCILMVFSFAIFVLATFMPKLNKIIHNLAFFVNNFLTLSMLKRGESRTLPWPASLMAVLPRKIIGVKGLESAPNGPGIPLAEFFSVARECQFRIPPCGRQGPDAEPITRQRKLFVSPCSASSQQPLRLAPRSAAGPGRVRLTLIETLRPVCNPTTPGRMRRICPPNDSIII